MLNDNHVAMCTRCVLFAIIAIVLFYVAHGVIKFIIGCALVLAVFAVFIYAGHYLLRLMGFIE